MSLLMDALKKAEEEKKKAAKRLEEVESGTDSYTEDDSNDDIQESGNGIQQQPAKPKYTSALSLEPISSNLGSTSEEPIVETKSKPDTDSVKREEGQREVTADDASETYSDDRGLGNTNPDLSLEDSQEQVGLSDTTVIEGLSTEGESMSLDNSQEDIDLSDTTIIEGLSTEDASAPFDDTFHGVVLNQEQESETYEETLPGIPAEQLVKDLELSGYNTTPAAAQTVFSAGNAGKRSSNFHWSIILVLAVLAISSFAVFYYFTITPVTRKMPSPIVARGIEATPEPLTRIVPLSEPDVVSGTIISSEPEIQETEDTITQAVTETKYINNESVIENNQIQLEQTQESQVSDVVDIGNEGLSEVVTETDNSMDVSLSETVVSDSNDDAIETSIKEPFISVPQEIAQGNTSLVDISKSKIIEKQDRVVNEAYKAYNAGQFDAARSLYQGVLNQEPDNRDAHLGLAAIAVNNNDLARAYSHYIKLLEINPKDAIALNALISISGSSDPVVDESAIKLLLQQEGDIPYLYFSLGNIYAKQQRWSEAQQAFFEAYRLDTTNPDYVHNMAISLDRLGQYSSALDYYKTAIDLAQRTPAKFDMTLVKRRINKLNNIKDPEL